MSRFPHLCPLVRRHYKAILVVSAVATAVGVWLTSRLSLDSDLAALLPDDVPSVQAMDRVREEVGGTGQLRIALESDSFPAIVALADALSGRLLESEFVNFVDYRNDVEFYERHALLFLDTASLDSLYGAVEETIEAEKRAANPFVVDDLFGPPEEEAEERGGLEGWEEEYSEALPRRYFVNEDSTVLVLSVYPSRSSADLDFSRRMLEDVQRIVEEAGPASYAQDMEVYYGSNIKNAIDEFEAIRADIVGTAAYGLGGVFLVLVVYFRSLVVPLLVSVSLLASISWTFGLTYLLVGQLNTITGFLFVVLFGMGIDYGIHAIARYRESREAGLDLDGAIHQMVCRTGSALATTAVTTSAAFFSLMLLQFKGFSELGLITGMGMLFTLAAMVVFLPALVIALDRIGLLRVEEVPGKEATAERRRFRYARSILVTAGVVTLAAAYLFSQVSFQYDFTDLRYVTEEREEFGELTGGVFTRSESPAIVLAGSRAQVDEVVEEVRARMRADTASPTVASVQSIFDLIPANQERKLEQIREIRELIDEQPVGLLEGEARRRVERLEDFLTVDAPFDFQDVPVSDRREFTDRSGEPGNFVFIYPDVALRDGRNAIAFRDDIGTITTESGEELHAASSNLIVADLLTIILREGPIAVGLSLAVVFLIVLADFRRVKAAVLVISPLVLGIVLMGGAMRLLGMQLNFFNIVVFPSIVGIGVDNGVHIYHRFQDEGADSLYFVLRRTGVAIAMTTLTTMVGYSGLALAAHPGLESIGELAIVGLGTTFLAAVVVLPALIEVFEKGGRTTGGSEPGEGRTVEAGEGREALAAAGGARASVRSSPEETP